MNDKEQLNKIKSLKNDPLHYPPDSESDYVNYIKKDYFNWLIEQAEHKHILQDRLQKRGTERKRMINTLKRNKRTIGKLKWDLMVSEGVANQSMESNGNNYERANKLEEQNNRYREAIEEANDIARNHNIMSDACSDINVVLSKALEESE